MRRLSNQCRFALQTNAQTFEACVGCVPISCQVAASHSLPQIQHGLGNARSVHGAGLRLLSKISKLQHLRMEGSFENCTHYGLNAALASRIGTIGKCASAFRTITN
jgi:hypothetical protein